MGVGAENSARPEQSADWSRAVVVPVLPDGSKESLRVILSEPYVCLEDRFVFDPRISAAHRVKYRALELRYGREREVSVNCSGEKVFGFENPISNLMEAWVPLRTLINEQSSVRFEVQNGKLVLYDGNKQLSTDATLAEILRAAALKVVPDEFRNTEMGSPFNFGASVAHNRGIIFNSRQQVRELVRAMLSDPSLFDERRLSRDPNLYQHGEFKRTAGGLYPPGRKVDFAAISVRLLRLFDECDVLRIPYEYPAPLTGVELQVIQGIDEARHCLYVGPGTASLNDDLERMVAQYAEKARAIRSISVPIEFSGQGEWVAMSLSDLVKLVIKQPTEVLETRRSSDEVEFRLREGGRITLRVHDRFTTNHGFRAGAGDLVVSGDRVYIRRASEFAQKLTMEVHVGLRTFDENDRKEKYLI